MIDFTQWAGLFPETFDHILGALRNAPRVETGEWHAQDVSGSPSHATREIQDAVIAFAMPQDGQVGESMVKALQERLRPALPWAEEHFLERVSRTPHNPPPSAARWPYSSTQAAYHTRGGEYSHTYPERFWPKEAGKPKPGSLEALSWAGNTGIRFHYGDLDDICELFRRNKLTRQAYLPVWFPEDLDAATRHPRGERVPCSLGYHFMVRNNRMTVRYYMRSCEFKRHLRDDLYMAARLLQWVIEHTVWQGLEPVLPARVIMHITSLHILEGDL